jgi:hypothetical protein
VSEYDFAAALEGTDAYVTERRFAKRTIVSLDARRDREHGHNTDNPAPERRIGQAPESTSA